MSRTTGFLQMTESCWTDAFDIGFRSKERKMCLSNFRSRRQLLVLNSDM